MWATLKFLSGDVCNSKICLTANGILSKISDGKFKKVIAEGCVLETCLLFFVHLKEMTNVSGLDMFKYEH